MFYIANGFVIYTDGKVTTTMFLDFIVFAEYKFKIRGEDDDGDRDDGDLTILPSNSAPTILIVPSPVDVLETQTSKSLLTSITAMDIDPGDTPSYSLSSAPTGPFSVEDSGKYTVSNADVECLR